MSATVEQVLERRLRTLRELAAHRGAATMEDACRAITATLATNPDDVPYAAICLLDDTGALQPVASTGALTPSDGEIALPLAIPDHSYGVLIARVLDDRHRTFLELVASQVVSGLTSARAQRAVATERRRMRELFELAPAAICMLRGPAHVFELANPGYREVIGNRACIGLPITEVLPEIVSQGLLDILDGVYRTGTAFVGKEFEVLLAQPSGLETRYFDFIYEATRDADGAIDGVFVFAFDVTTLVVSRRRIDEQRAIAELAQGRAEIALQTRDEFLKIASHELRTPLTTLGLQIDGLHNALTTKASEPSRAIAKLARMREQTERLEELVQAMLDALGARGIPPSKCSIDLADVVRVVADRLQHREKAMIEVTAKRALGEWDPRHLDTIVTHLLSNAVKFGGGKVDVTVEPRGEHVHLEVTDHGIGLAPSDHDRVFERFERATSSNNFGGLGLGLWIARDLVTAMQGTIEVKSRPGHGATFIVDLPRAT